MAQVEAFLDLLRHGQWRTPAAEAVGWSPDSVQAWIRRGRGAAGPQRPPTARYVAFADAVRRAEAQAAVNLIAVIHHAGDRDWRAAAWILERRWPEQWGPPSRRSPEAAPARPGLVERYVYVDAVKARGD